MGAQDEIKKMALTLPERHRQKQLTLASTGRHILISYPDDTTDQELMDFVAWLLTGFRSQLPPQGLAIAHDAVVGHD